MRQVAQWADRNRRGRRVIGWTWGALPLLVLSVVPAVHATHEFDPGVRVTLQRLLERRDAMARGERYLINEHWAVRAGFTERADNLNRKTSYSPDLQTVFEFESPGFFPDEPDYYLFDGAWYVYEPRSFDDPGLQIRAVPRAEHQRRRLEEWRHELGHAIRLRGLDPRDSGAVNRGFEMVVPLPMPGALGSIFGDRETSIRVTGRESISFAGESRRISPFIQSEQGRGQSLFPRLDMDQDLQVKLEGTVGGKVHLAVDHNSNAFGADANRINIWYEGFEDDIVQRIDLGGTNLTLPGSNLVSFAGGSQGLFGVKTDLRLGGLDLTVIASKEETETETRTLTPSGGSSSLIPIVEKRYARDRFFFYEMPGLDDLFNYGSWGIDPSFLIDQNRLGNFHIFIDDRNPNTEQDRNFEGYAVAQLLRGLDAAQMDTAFRDAPAAERWPDGVDADPDSATAKWRLLDDNEVGWVYLDLADGTRRVLGFYLRYGSLDDDDVLGVSFDSELGGTVGEVDYDAATVKLRLIRHPVQDAVNDEASFLQYPTNLLMMRHVYVLGAANVQDLEIVIESRSAGDQTPDTPESLPNSTYLHMFGLDDFDQANAPNPDGVFDQFRANLIDRENGFLFMPGLRPFSPPDEIVSLRLQSAGIDSARAWSPASRDTLFGRGERVDKNLYILPDDGLLPGDQFDLLVRTTGTETEITLPQDIEEGSERVLLDGRQLTAGVDYDIEPIAGGSITFKGDVLNEISPDSRIEVSYRYRPLVGTGQASLFGASGQYNLGQRGRLASVWLFESRRGFTREARLGEEPTRTLLGDVNGNLRFQPAWMTRLANLLPFTSTNAPSSLQITGEAAVSVPNPNTKDNAFVDDLEGADDSDRVTVARTGWHWASIPNFDASPTPEPARMDALNRVDVAWFNPRGLVKRGHLNPELDETEADDGLTVLHLGFHRDQVRELVDSLGVPPPDLWSGVMTAFGGNGLDLTQMRTIEFWLNDFVGEPSQRRGRMHIDFGDISEDFVLYSNNPNRPGGPLTNPRFNREAERQSEFLPGDDDLGFNGVDDNCDAISALEDDQAVVPIAWPATDCHIPSIRNPTLQHAWANGSQGNNQYDTEDINSDGEFDLNDRYFRFTMDLADLEFVDIDVNPQYGDQNFGSLNAGFHGWRRYRIDFETIRSRLVTIRPPGQTEPSLRQIRYLRIWFEDPDAPLAAAEQIWMRDIQMHDFKFTGNQWLQLGVYAVDSTGVVPQVGESFSISTINNKDDTNYVLPPGSRNLDAEGVQGREQALRMNYGGLTPGREMVAQKTNPGGRPLDFTLYNQMSYFVFNTTGSDSVEFFFRVGTDSLNYYEVATDLGPPTAGSPAWREVLYELRSLTDLKFPDDIGVQEDTLSLYERPVVQVTRFVPDFRDPDVILRMTRRGNPSLKNVTRMFMGVRHLEPALDTGESGDRSPSTGEVWFNNIRLWDVDRDVGVAQVYSGQASFADVFDVTASLSKRGADFRGLRERTGSGRELLNFQNRMSTELSRVIPTLGFTVPVTYTYSRSVSRPKFFTQSDTENTPERAHEQRDENVRRGLGLSLNKRPSKFWLFKPTIDRVSFSYNESKAERRTYTTRDTSKAWSQNFNYDLSPRERSFPVGFKQRLNLLPTNVKFTLRHQKSRGVNYTVPDPRTGIEVQKPNSLSRSMNVSASAAFRPLRIVSARYNFNEPRSYRDAHPNNEAERLRFWGLDFGIPSGRTEALAFDLSPRLFRFSYAGSYGDRRITSVDPNGELQPDRHQFNSTRTRSLSFDFGVHRRLTRWKFLSPGDEQSRAPAPPAAAADSAAADSTAAEPKRARPNPLKFLLRRIGSIDPVKVELSDTRTASYVGVPQEASYAYRFGFTTDSGVPGHGTPTPINRTNRIDLSSAIPLRGALRLTVRYTRRETEVEARSGSGGALNINRNTTLENTFPSLDLNISDFHKLRIFGPRLERSTLSLGYNRSTSERGNRDFDSTGQLTRESNVRQTTNTTFNSNWTGQWGGTTSTNLTFTQNGTRDDLPGQKRQGTRRNIQGNMRFRIAPQGGLKLPLFGTLKTGMYVVVSAGFNTDESKVFNQLDTNPEFFIVDRKISAINVSTRGDYTLSRSMNGGLEIGYARNHNARTNQTVTTVRLSFNLTFLF
jgi:hypothetical protein